MSQKTYCPQCGQIHDNRLRPLAIHGSLVSVLRQFWGNPQNIIPPSLRHCVWHKEEESSGIRIGDITEYAANYAQKRPAIIAKLGRIQCKKIAIASRIHQYAASLGLSPENIRINHWVGDETVFCLGENAMQTRLVADTVFDYLESMSDVIQQSFCCRDWSPKGVDELGILKEANDTFVMPIVIQFEYETIWALYSEGPPLRKVKLTVNPQ